MVEFILYVADQGSSAAFYKQILNKEPVLDVPGMTEFLLADNVKLGLMPEAGIAKILGNKVPHPSNGNGIPRCELYLYTDDIDGFYLRLQQSGAVEISAIQDRDWGDRVCYFADPDGHITAVAQRL
jgi:uncharacterized glyoxalase superfamily protein PhnB